MNVNIRKAALADLPVVSGLCAAHSAYEKSDFGSAGHVDRLAAALSEPTPRLVVLLAFADTEAVGYASLSREFSTWRGSDYLHLDCLFVVEAMRGKRIGRQLFDAVLLEARSNGLEQMQWQTPVWNADAIRFYRSLGAIDQAKARFVLNV